MENSTTPQDLAAMSPASDGSVAASVDVYIDKSACGFPESRPLRRPQPTLTDAEREAVDRAASAYEYNDDDPECARLAATLRGLLERVK